MKFLEPRTDLTSYQYPLIKLFSAVAVIAFELAQPYIFPIPIAWLDAVVRVIFVALAILCAFCIVISVGELCQTHENRKEKVPDPSKAKVLTIDTVLKTVSENAIVDIEACADGKIVKIGASADCKYASAVFTDKRFYLSDTEYETLGQFTDALTKFFPDGTIPVLKIDDLPVK